MAVISTLLPHLGQNFLLLKLSYTASIPHSSQTCIIVLSESNLSFNNNEAPCATKQSFSISPSLRPPPLLLPSTGCLVNSWILPEALACNLFAAMYFNLR